MRNYRKFDALFAIVLVATGCVGVPLDVPKEATIVLTNTGEGREAQKLMFGLTEGMTSMAFTR